MASVNYDLFNYVAAQNPNDAKSLLAQNGYDASTVDTVEVLGSGLAELVKQQGESGLKAVLSIHPDREAIVQEFAPVPAPSSNGKSGGCGCGGGCKGANALESYLNKINPASANTSSNGNGNGSSSAVMQHSNMLLIGGILILAVAIIVTKNN